VSLLVLIAASWAVGSLVLGLLMGRILRRVGRRYPAPRDEEDTDAPASRTDTTTG
jgi:hypothetical protein